MGSPYFAGGATGAFFKPALSSALRTVPSRFASSMNAVA
jgi:hypothetical protein